MPITIRKIAKDLNLAVSTVSKALSDSYEISDETKRMVLKYAQEHQYVPSAYAGSLKNRRSKNIAVVVPEVADTFFSNAINGIDSVAQEEGYHVLVYLTHESAAREYEILHELKSGRVDGVLISVSAGVDSNSRAHSELADNVPFVFFDRVCKDVAAAKVVTDDFESSYRATLHLLDKGCKSPLYIDAGPLSITEERRQGFLKALTLRGISSQEERTLICAQDESQNIVSIRRRLVGKHKPDGVIASVEKLAMHVYEICNEEKIRIPEDVKVIAFSNLRIAGLLAPPLSCVYQPSFEMGQRAAKLLFDALAKKTNIVREHIVLPSRFEQRESSK